MSEDEADESKKDLKTILDETHPASYHILPPVNLQPYTWREIRLFLSSSFIDTHAERDALIKNVIPNLNREFASRFIRIVPVDLRWGVLKDESRDCFAIQKTCLNALDACRLEKEEYPWFLGLRTERYGWVQDQLMTKDGFENPDKFDWVEVLKENDKQLSITSLECIHATHPLPTVGSAPTIFCYKRQITNYENVESDLRWVFDFEYVPEEAYLDPEVQYQYVKTEKARTYEDDRNSLDSYLKSLDYVKYTTYECKYEKGNAMYTCKNEGRKSFGVGYVSDLDDFEKKVEKDLSDAIKEYFSVPDFGDLGQHELDSIQHENAINTKAANFVGRNDLTDIIWEFCQNKEEELENGNNGFDRNFNVNNDDDESSYDGRSITSSYYERKNKRFASQQVDSSSLVSMLVYNNQPQSPSKQKSKGCFGGCFKRIMGKKSKVEDESIEIKEDNNEEYGKPDNMISYGSIESINGAFDTRSHNSQATYYGSETNDESQKQNENFDTRRRNSRATYYGSKTNVEFQKQNENEQGRIKDDENEKYVMPENMLENESMKDAFDTRSHGSRATSYGTKSENNERNSIDFSYPYTKEKNKVNNISSHTSSIFGINTKCLMIIHGEPGCGKSAILAKISSRCLNELRQNGHFVFVHAVDSCPRSNSLEKMLRRLHTNLRRFVKKLTGEKESKDDEYNDQSATLKKEHVKMLENTAREHPEKLFVILVDAVNQFHESLQAWSMWWLPSKRAPSNLHFVISSLNEENGTFKNASELHKHACKVTIPQMNEEDAQAMVSKTLEKYNKKLTTEDDWLLGNQMATLLSKSLSPLYLNASTQALRCFGIFEKLSDYIRQLPSNVKDLFIFLVKEWSEEYGEQFIKDVTGMLALSRDGLLENEINDILLFNEKTKNIAYDCSFSRLYDSICGFLAAGGGGYLRFFHDQLKNVIKERVIPTDKDKEQIHFIFVEFYNKCIQSQLCESPNIKPSPYYTHCLQQIVHHQISAKVTADKENGYSKTLRNIFFIRERTMNDQNTMLQDEFIDAMRASTDDKEKMALKQWSKFSQIYSPYIKRFPEWALNMALNQSATSYVFMDTHELDVVPMTHGRYPYYWTNAPSEEDYLALKYTLEETRCCTSSQEKNLCAIGLLKTAIVMEADTGSVVHHLSTDMKGERISVIHFSSKFNTIWTGTLNSVCYIWNVETGTEEWRTDFIDEKERCAVTWIDNVGENMAVGVASSHNESAISGIIKVYNEESCQVIYHWDIEGNTYCFTYSPIMDVIICAHDSSLKLWSVQGSLVNEFPVNAKSYSKDLENGNKLNIMGINFICPHPTKKVILFSDFGSVQQMNAITGYIFVKITEHINNALYSNDGEKIIGFNWCNIFVYSCEGTLLNKILGHSNQINEIFLGAGKDDIITAALDGSYSVFIPLEADKSLGSSTHVTIDIFVNFCALVCQGRFYVTLDRDANLALWDAVTHELIKSVGYKTSNFIVASLEGKYLASSSNEKEIYFFDIMTLEKISDYNVCNEGNLQINDLKLSEDGSRCAYCYSKAIGVLDISDGKNIKVINTFEFGADHVDLHQDNETLFAVNQDGVIMRIDIKSGEIISEFGELELPTYLKLLYNPDRILYGDDESLFVVDMKGNNKIKLKCTLNPIFVLMQTLNNGEELMVSENDNTISFHDLATGDVVYTFIDHRSTRFTAFLIFPDYKTIFAFNRNGIKYVLEKK